MDVRTYGDSGSVVVVLHGGPGAGGYMAPVARSLSQSFRVLEPTQRGSSSKPLTVAQHIDDLHELIMSRGPQLRPALVGSSWGAMLALAYAAQYPDSVGPLVLIGCGTFDLASRNRLREILTKRKNEELAHEFEQLSQIYPDADDRLKASAQLLLPVYSYGLITTDLEISTCDAQANQETWKDMIRLQKLGVYPQTFSKIAAAVLMLHGAFDPHPGEMIRDSLLPHLPQLEFRQWEKCGHYPWLERFVHEEFLIILREWLLKHNAQFQ